MSTPSVTPIDVPATTLVGVSGQFTSGHLPDSDAHMVIPQLWGRLSEAAGSSFHDARWSVGVMNDLDGEGLMNYFAAIRLDDNGGQSDGLEIMELPGGPYIACEHVGSLDAIGETTKWFYAEYLPSEGIQVRDGYHLEIYDERFDPDSASSVVLICAPV